MAYDWQKKKYQGTHEKLLEVAAGTLRKHGVKKASVAKVMAAAGLTVGAFYAHFASKKDLIKKSFAWAVDVSGQRIDRIPKQHPGDKLSAFLDQSLSAEHRDTPGDGCPLAALSLDFTREDEGLRRFFAGTLGEVNGIAGFKDALPVAAGSIFQVSPVPEPETYALMLAGLSLLGFVARRRKAGSFT